MPLPSGDQAWPPIDGHRARKYREHRAWYEGNIQELQAVYQQATSAGGIQWAAEKDGRIVRRSQYAGGVVGAVARFFWGQPNPAGEQRNRSHVPLAAEIASTSADQLFSENLDYEWPEGVDPTRVEEILDGVDFQSFLLEAAEVCAALSGVFLRIVWDDTVADYPLPTAISPDDAVGEFRFGRLQAATFWQVAARDGSRVFRHLERHEKGAIEHGLFVGTEERLGRRIPLTETEVTAPFALMVNDLSQIETGYPGLTAAYVPNIKPSRHRHRAELGRSDLDGIEHLLDELDEIETDLQRELRLSKARAVTPQHMLDSDGPGQGAHFDLDRELFVGVDTVGSAADGWKIVELIQPDIRVDKIIAAYEHKKAEIIDAAGYSAQTFGMSGDVAMTATEAAARERKSLTTREKKTRYWSAQLGAFIEALTAVDAAKFPAGKGVMVRPKVVFPASVQPSMAELTTLVTGMENAKAASIETKVKTLHPDWDDEQVSLEVGRIQAEQGMMVPDIGAPPDQGAADQLGMLIPDPTQAPAVPAQA